MLQEHQMHKYQRRAVNHIIENTHSLLLLEMGLGKTISTLTAAKILMYEELEIDTALVVAPKRVAESVWDAEVRNWSHTNNLRVSKITGNVKQRKAALRAKADIYTISRDNIAWLCGLYGSRLPFDMLIIDELSSFKNPQAKRFKALKLVQAGFKRVVGLTGTPAPNGLIDLWAQMYLIDRGERLGKFIGEYRRNFFFPKRSKGHVVYEYGIQQGSDTAIYDAIDDITLSMKAEDYLDLPERINNIVNIPFDDDLMERYKNFEKEKVLEFLEELGGEEPITAANAAGLSNKLQQFANGAVYNDKKEYKTVHSLKLDALKDIVEDANGSPVLVAYAFQSDKDRILSALKKYKPKVLDGDQDIQDWNAGKIRVLIMHPMSGGHGLNLQKGGHNIVWYGNTWSLELLLQFNARLHRQGQTKGVVMNKLVIPGTVDERIIAAQERKDGVQNGLMEAMKETIDQYRK